MSGVHDDLATLREGLTFECDGISTAIGEGCGECRGCRAYAALSRVEAEVARLEQERDEANRLRDIATEWAAELAGKKQAAEAEVARLRDGLRRIAETARWYADNDQRLAHEVDHALCVEVLDEAERALLADQDGAA